MATKYCKVCDEKFNTKKKHGRVKLQVRNKKTNPEIKNLWYCSFHCLKSDIAGE